MKKESEVSAEVGKAREPVEEGRHLLHGAEEDAAESDSGVLRDLGAERREKSAERSSTRAGVVPVEAKREHSESLVSVGTSEDASEPRGVAPSEAEDRDTGESRGDELCSAKTRSATARKARHRRSSRRSSVVESRLPGNHSQTKMAMKTYQKKRRRFFCEAASGSR